ncbi:MAG TPA: hypothetical protein VFN31_02600 [Candidatus Saccharimonadales bacterium]|nr:hypothetical protein [Candidatus Saccharimonadales bacterium]
MDEIINTFLKQTAGIESRPCASLETSPYYQERMNELDEEYRRTQKKLIQAVQSITHKDYRELEAIIG